MVLYRSVEKLNTRTQEWEPLYPLRVVGFAYELGHKVARERGLGSLSSEDFKLVTVSGGVRVRASDRWRKVPRYSAKDDFLRRFVPACS